MTSFFKLYKLYNAHMILIYASSEGVKAMFLFWMCLKCGNMLETCWKHTRLSQGMERFFWWLGPRKPRLYTPCFFKRRRQNVKTSRSPSLGMNQVRQNRQSQCSKDETCSQAPKALEKTHQVKDRYHEGKKEVEKMKEYIDMHTFYDICTYILCEVLSSSFLERHITVHIWTLWMPSSVRV